MKAKLQQVRQTVNPFSGINFIIAEFNKIGIPKLFDTHLGKRVKQSTYKYSDVLLTWIYSNLCGAERLEDTIHLKEYFSNIPKFKFCSSDRIAGIFKSFSSFNLKLLYKDPIKAQQNEHHQFNINLPLNKLMVATAVHTKLIKKNVPYTLDYDNYIVETEKFDSRTTYQECKGYCPGVAFIGKIPVYVEGRNGNTPARVGIAESVNRAIKLLKSHEIKVGRFRSDAAAYQKEVMNMAEQYGMEFFIRAIATQSMYDQLRKVEWRKIENNGHVYEIGHIMYKAISGSKKYRFVVTRSVSLKRNKINPKTFDDSTYRFLITNNETMIDEDVFRFYNARGNMERNFDALGNDFNWKRVPFSYMHQNTSFLIIGGITNILYEYAIRKFSTKLHFVSRKQRLKAFILSFIAVSGHWVVMPEGFELQLYTTTRDYNNLWLEGCFESG